MKTIYLKGDIGWEITADGIREMIDMKSTQKLQVLINSSGGLVFEALEIYDLFKTYKGQVEFVIMPYAASAASYVVMAGDKISAFKNSIWMAHRVSSIAIGDADEMMITASIMQSLENVIVEAYKTRMPGTAEEIVQRLSKEIWLIGWEQLTENNIIDNVIDKIDEVHIEDEDREEIEKAIEEAESENASKLLAMRLQKTETRMKNENIDFHNQYEKIAAKIDMDKIVAHSGSHNVSKTVDTVDDKIYNTGEKMNLQDFLKSNPEAKAEYESTLESAKAEGKESVTPDSKTDAMTERQRIYSILEAADVPMTDTLAEAINQGMTDGEYAKAELARQKGKRAAGGAVDFGKLVKTQTPGDQDPAGAEEVVNGDQDEAEKMKAFEEKLAQAAGKKKGDE